MKHKEYHTRLKASQDSNSSIPATVFVSDGDDCDVIERVELYINNMVMVLDLSSQENQELARDLALKAGAYQPCFEWEMVHA